MGKRRKARELAIQVLFHLEFSADDPHRGFDLICENFRSQASVKPFSLLLVQGVCAKREELDELIVHASNHWRLERMARLDKCILRMATYELLFIEDIPPKVSIHEAVDLGKKFGGEDSGSFINGILDNIYNTLLLRGRLKAAE